MVSSRNGFINDATLPYIILDTKQDTIENEMVTVIAFKRFKSFFSSEFN